MGSIRTLINSPLLRRVSWHMKRIADKVDRHFFFSLLLGLVVILAGSALAVWAAETVRTLSDFGASFYWAVTTVLGQGDASYVSGPVGWAVSWLLGLFGVAIVATITGALVGFVIDFLIKEGQGMGAAGYSEHIVICGWNSTARDLITELSTDAYKSKLVLLADFERNPAGDSVYFVRGDTSDESDLRRAGIETALSAIVCPADGSKEADMASILTVLAIESIAPEVRTVVESQQPRRCSPLSKGKRQRGDGHFQAGGTFACSLRPVSRALRADQRYRLRGRRVGALSGSTPRRLRRPQCRRSLSDAAPRPRSNPARDEQERPSQDQSSIGFRIRIGRQPNRHRRIAGRPQPAGERDSLLGIETGRCPRGSCDSLDVDLARRFLRGPIGENRPLFDRSTKARPMLVDTRQFGNGVVMLRYRVQTGGGKP